MHKPVSEAPQAITIAQGLDALYTSRDEMAAYGVPERILKQMDYLGAWTKGTGAVIPEESVSFTLEKLTEDEFYNVSNNIANESRKKAVDLRSGYPGFSDEGIGILLSLDHWGGSYESSKESKLTRHKNNIEKGTADATGKLISPVKEVLENREATDKDLIKAMKIVRDSYVPWGVGKETSRYKTLDKYINRLK